MSEYRSSDVLEMKDFELAWRITDARWSSLPEAILSRIKPLSSDKALELLKKSPLAQPLSAEFSPFQVTRHVSLEDGEETEGTSIVAQWFEQLPIEPDHEVYVCWYIGRGVAVVTDWSTFVKVWDDLWYPFDHLCVFDESRRWAVVLGPEERALFLERAPCHSPEKD